MQLNTKYDAGTVVGGFFMGIFLGFCGGGLLVAILAWLFR